MLVYVLNRYGKPLMPCKPSKARKLLNLKKAIVIKREPFTLRLLYGSSGYTQPITLGVDAGAKHVGLSVTTEKQELYSSDVELRTDIVGLISTRREMRRSRRNRKTRYRKTRFKNRKKPKGWLAPSVENKINAHIIVIGKICSLLPITKIVVETASFDIQKIKDPAITGIQYQKGDQLGFWNVREYILFRDNHTCQHCKGKSKDPVLNVHHIQSRKTGGDAPNNLITLCKTCHNDYHSGKITLNFKRGNNFKEAAFMNIMKNTLLERLKVLYPNVENTYGYITKNTRLQLKLPKEHYIDAYCITGNIKAKRLDYYWYQKQVRKHNRQIHKATILKGGKRKLNQSPYLLFNFRLFDKVLCNNTVGFIFGRRASGSFLIKKLDGTTISAGITYKKLKLLSTRKSYLLERRLIALPPHS